MYTVIGSRRSRALRVIWCLEELGQTYDLIEAGPRSDEIRAVNPSGKVPALKVDDTVLTDSTAIMTYLADAHGALTYPAGTLDRARQDALTHMLLDEFDAVLWTAARHSFVLPEEHRMPEIKDSLKWEFANSAKRLADMLGDGPFLMGETMTVADILAAHCLSWATNARFPVEEPALTGYLARMRDRPAFQRAIGKA